VSGYLDFINYNLSMLKDRTRVEAYRRAVYETVRPKDVVLDLGCGSGILALFACQAGAKRVYAIESEDVIDLARQICPRNGFQDRIVFIKERSFRVDLPEKVNVLVTETLGTFGLDEGLVGSVLDARERFLDAGGSVVPARLLLSVVPIELPGFYDHMVEFWGKPCHGLDLTPVRRLAANYFHPIKIHEEAFLSAPTLLADLPLASVKTSDVQGEMTFYASRRGFCHGLAGWFAADLVEGVRLSNSPTNPDSHWGVAFFPFEQPVPIHRGTRITVELDALANGSLWRWRANVNGHTFEHETPSGFQQGARVPHKVARDRAPS
jgi:SAM-dependent methyltransferase